jgi:hypothetical protein
MKMIIGLFLLLENQSFKNEPLATSVEASTMRKKLKQKEKSKDLSFFLFKSMHFLDENDYGSI